MLECSVAQNQTFIILLPYNGEFIYTGENYRDNEEYSLFKSYNEILLESIITLVNIVLYGFL